MLIRTYQPGDEQAQARIYNAAAGSLPAFKPASPEEIARRYQGDDADPGIAVLRRGRWRGRGLCGVLRERAHQLSLVPARGGGGARAAAASRPRSRWTAAAMPEAWAAYRADWSAVLDFLRGHGFVEKRQMINYLADVSRMPGPPRSARGSGHRAARTRRGLPARGAGPEAVLRRSSRVRSRRSSGRIRITTSPRASSRSRSAADGRVLGGLPAGDERPVRRPEQDRRRHALLPPRRLRHRARATQARQRAVLLRRSPTSPKASCCSRHPIGGVHAQAGLTHVAAQAPSDAVALCAFYDRIFQRQGAFPILLATSLIAADERSRACVPVDTLVRELPPVLGSG